jgi:hypothetical protein
MLLPSKFQKFVELFKYKKKFVTLSVSHQKTIKPEILRKISNVLQKMQNIDFFGGKQTKWA